MSAIILNQQVFRFNLLRITLVLPFFCLSTYTMHRNATLIKILRASKGLLSYLITVYSCNLHTSECLYVTEYQTIDFKYSFDFRVKGKKSPSQHRFAPVSTG